MIATVLQREVLPDAEAETSDDLSLGTPSPRFLIRSLSPSQRNGDSSIDEARAEQVWQKRLPKLLANEQERAEKRWNERTAQRTSNSSAGEARAEQVWQEHMPKLLANEQECADKKPDAESDTSYDLSLVRKEVTLYYQDLFGKPHVISDVYSFTTIVELKRRISDQMKVPEETLYLSAAGKILLDESQFLGDYGVTSESTLCVCLRMLGGAKDDSIELKSPDIYKDDVVTSGHIDDMLVRQYFSHFTIQPQLTQFYPFSG